MGVSYIPVVGLVGTDLLKRRDDMMLAPDPFDGKTMSVVAKSMRPDIAVFHVDKADRHGNVSCGYPVEAEEIVDRLDEKDAVGAFMPSILVDAVVHAPFGSHPAGMTGRYAPDKVHMQEYVAASRDDAAFAGYLKTYVFGVASHDEYVERFVPQEMKRPTRAA
jgi:hypothetical protein